MFRSLPLFLLLATVSCTKSKKEKQVRLYTTYCTSCHIAPAIDALPKALWKNKVLPDMAARMGIRDSTYDPYKDLAFNEIEAVMKTGVYPSRPLLNKEDWQLLKAYIINLAPETMPRDSIADNATLLSQFSTRPIALDSTNGSMITYLKYEADRNRILTGALGGELAEFDLVTQKSTPLGRSASAITDYTTAHGSTYLTAIGNLRPSEIANGTLSIKSEDTIITIPEKLHRPVHTLISNLDNTGADEIVISEFGDLKGKVSLWTKDGQEKYTSKTLLDQPGTIRVLAKDMNKDGKEDLIALTSQGDEGISILFQEDDLDFRVEKVIRFPPIYGSSWFELVDYDGDGDDDIITVHGDNADQTYIPKPYHGMRVHINDGNNVFEESYFFPMNGCTRVIAADFDGDSDVDFALLSTFPDYENHPDRAFVYLENLDAEKYSFDTFTLKDPNEGRWFLMDSGDFDKDGDQDLVLSSFTFAYSEVPDELRRRWYVGNTDLLLLENQLKP